MYKIKNIFLTLIFLASLPAPALADNSWDFEDGFEGSPPNGWSSDWSAITGLPTSLITTSLGGTPPGGGTYALEQHWASQSPDWPIYQFPELLEEGDVFELEYWIKYNASFDYNNTYIKQIIFRNNLGAGQDQEIYIIIEPGDGIVIINQYTTDTGNLRGNINGGSFDMPKGVWVHFRWQVKVSIEDLGDPRAGYIYGWVNGVKRFEYDNINTMKKGPIRDFNLNATFNDTVTGNNQRRYWDEIKVRVLPPDGTFVQTPTISPNGGSFTGSIAVELSTSTADAELRYTLDGTAPTTGSTLYSGPITLTESTTVRAQGYKSGLDPSTVVSADFTTAVDTVAPDAPGGLRISN